MGDSVHEPRHYAGDGIVRCARALESMMHGANVGANVGYWWGCAFKYLWRWHWKNGAEDLEKCIECIRRMLERIRPGKPSGHVPAESEASDALGWIRSESGLALAQCDKGDRAEMQRVLTEFTARRIAALMDASGLSAAEFGARIGVERKTVYSWRDGKTVPRATDLLAAEWLWGDRL